MKALEFTKLTNCVGSKIHNFSARLKKKSKTSQPSKKIKNDLSPDVSNCPFCSEQMKGIKLTHYKCKNCNEYFTN